MKDYFEILALENAALEGDMCCGADCPGEFQHDAGWAPCSCYRPNKADRLRARRAEQRESHKTS